MYFFSLYVYFLIERIKDSSVKRVDAFRIVLIDQSKLPIKQKHSKDSHLSILLSFSDTEKLSILILRYKRGTEKSLHNFIQHIYK